MKRLLLLLLVLLILVGCGDRTVSPDASPYQLLVSSADLSAGRSRLALTLWDGPERLAGVQEMSLNVFELAEDGSAAEQVWEGPAQSYEMGGTQYWVGYPEFPVAGYYGVEAHFTTAEGDRIANRALMQVREEPVAPAIGEDAPRSETRTLDDAPVEELTSAGPYVERFYEMSVAEAAESGRPSVIGFITPGHCTSALCGPVLQSMVSVSEETGDAVNFVHVEIYRSFTEEEQALDPAVSEWELPSEPWLFVLDSEGRVAARLDGPVGEEELRAAIAGVTGGG